VSLTLLLRQAPIGYSLFSQFLSLFDGKSLLPTICNRHKHCFASRILVLKVEQAVGEKKVPFWVIFYRYWAHPDD